MLVDDLRSFAGVRSDADAKLHVDAADQIEKLYREIGRLRTALRVNALRWGYSDAEIDAILRDSS